jgi:hypothetical protein
LEASAGDALMVQLGEGRRGSLGAREGWGSSRGAVHPRLGKSLSDSCLNSYTSPPFREGHTNGLLRPTKLYPRPLTQHPSWTSSSSRATT